MSAVANLRPVESGSDAEDSRDGLFFSRERLARIDPDITYARKIIRQAVMDLRDPKIIKGPTARPEGVIVAERRHERAMFDLVQMDLQENARIAPISNVKVAQLVLSATRQHGGIGAVIENEQGAPVAVQLMSLEKWWWSEQRFLYKVVDFVHPDYRRSTHAARLVQYAKWATDYFSEKFGHQIYLLSGTLGPKETKSKARFYCRHITQIGVACLYPYPHAWDGGPL